MNRIAPQWIVDNLDDTVTFYTEKLGFKIDWKGSLFAILSLDSVSIMFRQLNRDNLKRPNKIPFMESGWHTNGPETWDAYIWMDSLEAFYQKCISNKVTIIRSIVATDYGNREFEIEDINGYILCFGEKLKD